MILTFYPKFRKWCDHYFLIKHRGRGLGGIFFDDLNELLGFATEYADSVILAYIPRLEKRKECRLHKKQGLAATEERAIRRVYDRGTTFGLQTGDQREYPYVHTLTSRWEYDRVSLGTQRNEEATEEWKLVDACRNPPEWL
ncbi:hypothetical protein R1sor_015772 [Riccia sorocarpa]|uniref:coproporphyrinogen oxidase n=1 Tax=Riccia sorocarpa TaxID=122646 RepID=A0ABD3HD56_9MARC